MAVVADSESAVDGDRGLEPRTQSIHVSHARQMKVNPIASRRTACNGRIGCECGYVLAPTGRADSQVNPARPLPVDELAPTEEQRRLLGAARPSQRDRAELLAQVEYRRPCLVEVHDEIVISARPHKINRPDTPGVTCMRLSPPRSEQIRPAAGRDGLRQPCSPSLAWPEQDRRRSMNHLDFAARCSTDLDA